MKYVLKGLAVSLLVGVASTASSASIKEGMIERFNKADSNKDGQVTHEEMMSTIHKKFGEFDKNNDGYLELTELPKEMPVPRMMKEPMQEHLKKMAKRSGKDEAEIQERIEARFKKKQSRLTYVARLDKDGDERVSVDEFAGRKIQRFKRADQDGDGSVTLEELEEASAKMRRHHGKMKKKR